MNRDWRGEGNGNDKAASGGREGMIPSRTLPDGKPYGGLRPAPGLPFRSGGPGGMMPPLRRLFPPRLS